jgi:hypothetical protein
MLVSRIKDIVRAFDYLFRRFGPFPVTSDLVGWTQLGVKIWFNPDFSLNRKPQSQLTEETMISQILVLLSEKCLLPKTVQKISTFDEFFKYLDAPQSSSPKSKSKQVGFKPFKINNGSMFNFKPAIPKQPRQSHPEGERSKSNSKKNITFSYSNKDICTKSVVNGRSPGVFKRSSIQIDPNEQFNFLANYRLSAECTGKSTPPATSFKLIVPE